MNIKLEERKNQASPCLGEGLGSEASDSSAPGDTQDLGSASLCSVPCHTPVR